MLMNFSMNKFSSNLVGGEQMEQGTSDKEQTKFCSF
jgi:hypothetical protein